MGTTRLDGETKRAITQAVRLGASNAEAARGCGLHPATVRLWLRKGAAGAEPYHSLLRAVARARCAWRREMLAHIRRGAAKDWRAAAWALERLGGRRYRP